MNTSADTLADEVEPFLLRVGMVVRSTRGRVATVKAYDHLKLPPPGETSADDQGRLF
jgi:Holliday junction DNA helicase RuvB